MALTPVTLPVRFLGGLETKIDEKVVELGKWLELRNAVFTRGGTAAKRYGHTELGKSILGTTTQISGGVGLRGRGKELCYLTDSKLYTYQDDNDAWREVADVMSIPTAHRVLANRSTAQTVADYAELGGVAVWAWEDSAGGVYCAVADADTDALIVAPRQLDATGSRPRVHALSSSIHVYWADAANNTIGQLVVDPTSPTAAASTIVTDIIVDLDGTDPNYDIDDDGSGIVIAWVRSTSSELGLGRINNAGALSGTQTISDDATMVAIARDTHADGNDGVTLLLADGTNVTAKFYDSGFVLQATVTVDASAANVTNLTCCYQAGGTDTITAWWEESAAAAQNYTVTRATVTTSAASGVTTQRGCGLGSKGFYQGTNLYAWLVHESTLFSTYLCQRSDGLVVSRALPGLANGLVGKPHLPTPKRINGSVVFAGTYVENLDSENNDVFTEPGVRRIDMDFASEKSHQTAEFGRCLYIGGGLLQVYDGQAIYEADFHMAPDDVAAPSESGSSGLSDGTYVYYFTYSRVLNTGETLISAVSAGVTVTVSSGPSQVDMTVPTYRFGDGTERIDVWRTENGKTDIAYRVSSLDPTATGNNKYLSNDPTADTVSFSDAYDDTTLLTKDPLYTTGGILSNDPVPDGGLVAQAKGRLFFDSPSDGDLVLFSQERKDGFGLERSPSLATRTPTFGGDVVGVVETDNTILIGKQTALYEIAGPGPFPNPSAGGGFTPPRIVTADAGIKKARTIEYTPAGVVFQSRKGIEMYGRDRQLQYIGAPVEKYTDPTRENQDFVAATLIQDRREVRFLTDSGSSLLYDYFFNTWSNWTITGKDACNVNGEHYVLRNDGAVWKESRGSYQDVGSSISFRMLTPHIKLAKILSGFQMLWRMTVSGVWKSAHTLRIRGYYDYEAGHDDEWIIDPSTFINMPGYGDGDYGGGDYGEGDGGQPVQRYQAQVHIGRQCTAAQFSFEFIEAAGSYGAAGELTEMVLTGGVLGPEYPQQDARRA